MDLPLAILRQLFIKLGLFTRGGDESRRLGALDEALAAFRQLNLLEGILPALESSHAIAYAMKLAAEMNPDQKIVVNLSGRGDKDIPTVARIDGISIE